MGNGDDMTSSLHREPGAISAGGIKDFMLPLHEAVEL
jgi:hypothetical protein